MAASLTQQATGSTASGTTVAASLTGVAAAARLIACATERDGNALSGITDTVNSAWTLSGNGVSAAVASRRAAIYSFPNSASGNPTATVTFVGTAASDLNLSEWSGTNTGAVDATNSNANASGTSHSCGSVTPSAAALIIAVLGTAADHGGATPPAGFTAFSVDGSAQQRCAYAYKVGHTGSVTPTFTTVNAVTSDCVVAAFLETGGGGGVVMQAITPRWLGQR